VCFGWLVEGGKRRGWKEVEVEVVVDERRRRRTNEPRRSMAFSFISSRTQSNPRALCFYSAVDQQEQIRIDASEREKKPSEASNAAPSSIIVLNTMNRIAICYRSFFLLFFFFFLFTCSPRTRRTRSRSWKIP
jgi:hypothetical protein